MELSIDKSRNEIEIYQELSMMLKQLVVPTDKLLSSLSNFVSMLKGSFRKISWVGFYIADNDKLFLGPFQGNTACTEILFGKGVCGTVAQTQSALIVDDVNKFSNHIACDSKSQSEIVIPIIIGGTTWGVLDVDSYDLKSFSEVDKNYLENFIEYLVKNLELNKFILR